MKLSKFVGRNELPSDKIAWQRLSQAFGNSKGPVSSIGRRTRIKMVDGRTKVSE